MLWRKIRIGKGDGQYWGGGVLERVFIFSTAGRKASAEEKKMRLLWSTLESLNIKSILYNWASQGAQW